MPALMALRMQKVLDQMGQEIQEMLKRSEVLGEQGDVDGSQAAATQAEAIKVRPLLRHASGIILTA